MKGQWLLKKPIAHRGLHTDTLPENSLGAFRNAIEHGFPIELDVHLTDDNVVVVFHDDTLGRMTGKDGYIGKISSDSLQSYKLLNAEGKPTEYSIPTFEEVLSLIDGQVPLLIEIKNEGAVGNLEKKTAAILSGYKGLFAVQSFNPYSIKYFKDHMPDVPRGILSCLFTKEIIKNSLKRHILKTMKLNKMAKPDFISYYADHLPNRYVSRAQLPVLAWTIRSNEMAYKVKGNANNIIFEKFIPENI